VAPPVKLRPFSRTSPGRCTPRRARLVALSLLLCGLLFVGCSKDTCHGTLVGSQCQPACDDSQCLAGARCVQNECRPSCQTDSTCTSGEVCRLWGFGDGTRGNYCVVLPSTSTPEAGTPEAGSPTGKVCTTNADCAADPGLACVAGTCRVLCTSHADCAGLGECLAGTDTDGANGYYCDLSKPQPSGQFYAHCPNGNECDANSGFSCVGSGAGDLDAYCTRDCTDDSTCADGFYCAPINRSPCSNVCNLTGVPKDPNCVPSDQIGDGKAYQCGSRGVTRTVCRPREFCTSCTTDADCFAVPNQVCAKDQSGAKICTQLCDPKHPSCPWGDAATCGTWDSDLGQATCAHRFGKCVGTGKGCEPCLRDGDCGTKGVCTSSSFSGEHWCVDLSVTCDCAGTFDSTGTCTGGGCPSAPSGLDMLCIGDPTSAIVGKCVGANTASIGLSTDMRSGCWPPR